MDIIPSPHLVVNSFTLCQSWRFDTCRGFVYDLVMKNIIRQTTEFALHIVRAYVDPGDVVIDATCGNGHDTLALAEMDPAQLYAFDAQESAVRATTNRLEANGYRDRISSGRIIVECLRHEEMKRFLEDTAGNGGSADASVKVIIFNLGYLPGGDKNITTQSETTLQALQASMDLIQSDGLICITMYSGHTEGKEEKTALLSFTEALDSRKWHCAYVSMPNQRHDPPEILLITKKP